MKDKSMILNSTKEKRKMLTKGRSLSSSSFLKGTDENQRQWRNIAKGIR